MSKLEIMLNKETYKPGEKVEGNLFLQLSKRTKVKGINVIIYGNEHTRITRTRYNPLTKKHETHVYTENVGIIDESESLLSKISFDMYGMGEQAKTTALMANIYTIPFSFTLPEDATPSYDGHHVEVEYSLSAKVSKPWWFDITAEKEILVMPKDPQEIESKSAVLKEKSGGSILPQALSPDISMIVELGKEYFRMGENIEGKVVVTNKSGKEVRNILLDLYANEHAEAEGYTEDTSVMCYSLKLPVHQPKLSYFEQDFNFQIPSDVMPTIKRAHFNIKWYFKIGLDVAKATDLETETYITVK